jgi:hypothetical protein
MHRSSSVGPLAHSSPLPFGGSAHSCCADSPLASLAFAFAFAFARILILLILELFCSYDGSFPQPTQKFSQSSKDKKDTTKTENTERRSNRTQETEEAKGREQTRAAEQA